MDRKTVRRALIGAAMVVAIGGAALGARAKAPSGPAISSAAPAAVEPFALAQTLSQLPPDVVVLSMGAAKHPLLGAVPIETLGDSDDAIVASAPKARRIVLAGSDAVRVDRLARRLSGTGRDVTVLAGGIEAWDKAMDADPPAPAPNAGAEVWDRYKISVGLRHYFGDAAAALPAMAAPPPVAAPAGGGGGAAPKKREGC